MKDMQSNTRPKRLTISDAGPPPRGTVNIGPGSQWANPFHGTTGSAAMDREMFREMIWGNRQFLTRVQIRAELSGRDLACTCEQGVPCHGDVLLEIANGEE
ncbi:MAG: DUF4326 domain-containing protein [Rhodobacteraceae bacterium]|nr:MAG: DUF4326 domain-containing protein [Paracoccaceae bacterium]